MCSENTITVHIWICVFTWKTYVNCTCIIKGLQKFTLSFYMYTFYDDNEKQILIIMITNTIHGIVEWIL